MYTDQALTVRGGVTFFWRLFMSPKPFSTLTEQVDILKSRGMIIEDEEKAKCILLRENYYNVINGYKKPFLLFG